MINTIPSPSGSGNVIPIFKKQVIVHNDSRLQIRINIKNMDTNFFEKKPETIQDFQNFLNEIDALNSCQGGPSINYFKNVNVRTAYKDDERWSHNKCPIILSTGSVCSHCSTLYKLLSQNQHRQKIKKLRTNRYAPEAVKNTIKEMCNNKRVIKQRLTRKERKLRDLTKELNMVHARIMNVQQINFDEKLKTLSPNLTENQWWFCQVGFL